MSASLWTFVGIVQGGIRGVVAPSEMCAGAVAIYWLGRTCRNSDRSMGILAAALCACGMACVGITLISGGVLGHVNLVACYLGMTVFAALAPVLRIDDTARRRTLLVSLGVTACWVLASGSRGAAVTMVASVIIILCVRHRERVQRWASGLTMRRQETGSQETGSGSKS